MKGLSKLYALRVVAGCEWISKTSRKFSVKRKVRITPHGTKYSLEFGEQNHGKLNHPFLRRSKQQTQVDLLKFDDNCGDCRSIY